jgi:hypothetical protein
MAEVTLQSSVQTHEFVEQWQNQSHMLWTTQSKINEELESKIGDLQQAVSWLGDQIVNIQHQLMLSCGWNITMYCVSLAKYNASQCNWEQIKYHLQDLRGNIILDVEEFKRDIFNTFKSKYSGNSYEGLVKGIVDVLPGIDPRS